MARAIEPAVVRLGPEELDRTLGPLARALASSAPPAGAVFEQEYGSTIVWLTARPSTLLLRTHGAPAGGLAAPASGRVGSRPLPRVRFGTVTALASDARSPAPTSMLPTLTFRLPDSYLRRLTVQTFWVPRPGGGVAAARRFRLTVPSSGSAERSFGEAGARIAEHWSARVRRVGRAAPLSMWRTRRAWRLLSTRGLPRAAWTDLSVEELPGTVDLPRAPRPARTVDWESGHIAVFGASGSGKTTFLSEVGAAAIARRRSVVVLDVHGDLAPAIVARLAAEDRARVVAVDVTDRPVPGFDVIGGRDGAIDDRVAAHLVAALKRLTPDGEEIYWGFRLERIFDAFVRLVQEEGGSLTDLATLLGSPERREAARARTRHPALAQFLDELAPVVKRHPDFLWAAATRLAKVTVVPGLRELLAPEGTDVPVDALFTERRSLLVRLPFSEIGPEASSFAATLLLTRIYLAAATRPLGRSDPILLLLDEAQGISPRLLSEVVTEGRKFGVHAVVATQYPERFAREAEAAVAGAVRSHVCFRVPRTNAHATAKWLGLRESTAEDVLSQLPIGTGLLFGSHCEPMVVAPAPPLDGPRAWRDLVERSRREYGGATGERVDDAVPDPLGERRRARLLLAAQLIEEESGPFPAASLLERAASMDTPWLDRAELVPAFDEATRRQWLVREGERWRLGPRGLALLGTGRPTGATRESAEHRALLLLAQRVLARRGCRLELIRQGRFDTTLPDGRVELLPTPDGRNSPQDWARALDEVRDGWAWRFFGGRNVHVEAEVSGALRPERVRRGLAKAVRAGAFALFVVADAERARKVRALLHAAGLVPKRAQVWTLPGARSVRPEPRSGPT